ncbi:Long-chain-fatty-acid--CoA ligase (EC 6.2.1.3) [Azospirillum doebereinerae]
MPSGPAGRSQTNGAPSTGDFESWCGAEIASFKKPKQHVFRDELPKNSYGKILKTVLRREFSAQRPPARHA